MKLVSIEPIRRRARYCKFIRILKNLLQNPVKLLQDSEERLSEFYVFTCSFSAFQHKGFCLGSHVTIEEPFEVRNPVGKKAGSLQNHNPVEVKCEIYEPQVGFLKLLELNL